MWKSTKITVDNKDYKVDVFVGVVDDTKNRTQTGISGGSFSTEKYGSSNISTTHTNFQEVWLVGSNNSEASISLKNNAIQVRKGNEMALIRIHGIDYWIINKTTNSKYQISENPSKLFLTKEGYLFWILPIIPALMTFFLLADKRTLGFRADSGLELLLVFILIFGLPLFWFIFPYIRHIKIRKRNDSFDEKFNSLLMNALNNQV